MRSVVPVLSAALVVIGMVAAEGRAAEFTFSYQKTLPVEPGVTVRLDLVRGSVVVTGTSDEQMVIEALKRVRATNREEAEEVADHIEIRVDASGREVSIGTNYLRMLSRSPSFWEKVLGSGSDAYGSVDYVISVPPQCSLAIRASAADIELSSIEGAVTVDNTAGVTRGEFLFGPVTVRQPQGTIDLRWVEGDIRVRSASGRITIDQSHGAVDLSTLSSEVKIQTELDSRRDFYVETQTGPITLLVPESSSGVLNIDTESGDIRSEMPIVIRSASRRGLIGEFGRGGPTVRLSSSSGTVTVGLY